MKRPAAIIDEAVVARALREIYIPGAHTRLREEEERKVGEMAPLLREVDGALRRLPLRRQLLLVDAAAGRGYVSLLAARLLLAPAGRPFRWVLIERDPARAESCRALARKEALEAFFEVRCAGVESEEAWPQAPDLVVALHACGPAADAVIERAAAVGARQLLLAPCCVSKTVAAHQTAAALAGKLSIPRQSPVRRKFLEAMIAAERTQRLESLGYLTEVLELCPPGITPQNLLWRCRRLGNPARMRRATDALAQMARLSRPGDEP